MAGTDTTLLGLAGAGYADGRSFGFAACERAVGASEGINLVQERRTRVPGRQVRVLHLMAILLLARGLVLAKSCGIRPWTVQMLLSGLLS